MSIAKNIKALRTLFGETQEDLAFAIMKPGKSAICNYEHGTIPPQEDLEMIAKHFGVTSNELISEDFLINKKIKIPTSKEELREIDSTIFPIISSKDALKNENFKKGYKANINLYESIFSFSNEFDENDINDFRKYYEKAIEEDVYEALANYLTWFILNTAVEINDQLVYGANKLFNGKLNQKEFLKDYVLYDYELKNIKNEDIDEESTSFIEEAISELKSCKNTYEIADYYSSLRYIYGMLNNGYSREENRYFGFEMMWDLVRLKNPYAINYMKLIFKYNTK